MPVLVLIAYGSLLALSLLDNSRGPFFPDILLELNLTTVQGSLFFAVTSAFAVSGSWLSDHFLKKCSTLSLLNISSLGLGIGFVFIALSSNLFYLVISCILFGFSFGILNVTQNLLAIEGSTLANRRKILNGLHSMYGLAALIAPLAANGFRQYGLSWRTTFIVLASAPLAMAVWGFLKLRKKSAVLSQLSAQPVPIDSVKVLAFATMLSIYLWAEIAASTRLVLWLREVKSFSPEEANWYLALFFLCLLVGRLTLSFIHVPINNYALLIISAIGGSVCYLSGLLISPEFFFAAGLFMAPFFPGSMDQLQTAFPHNSAKATGFVIGFGSLNVVVMHLGIGWLSQMFSLTFALGFFGVALLILGLTLLAVFSIRPLNR